MTIQKQIEFNVKYQEKRRIILDARENLHRLEGCRGYMCGQMVHMKSMTRQVSFFLRLPGLLAR